MTGVQTCALPISVAAAAAAAVAAAAANQQDGQQHHSSGGVLKPSSKYGHHGGQHLNANSHHHNGLMIRVDDTESERLQRHRHMMAPFNGAGQWPSPAELTPPDHHPQRISSSNRKRSHDSENHNSTKRANINSHHKKVDDEDEEINVDDVVDVESVGSSHDDDCGSCRSGSFDRPCTPNSTYYESMGKSILKYIPKLISK